MNNSYKINRLRDTISKALTSVLGLIISFFGGLHRSNVSNSTERRISFLCLSCLVHLYIDKYIFFLNTNSNSTDALLGTLIPSVESV